MVNKFNSKYRSCKCVFRFDPAGELIVKRDNDPWIVAKRSGMRELIVTVNQKNANLKEISGKIYFDCFSF